MSFSKKQWLVGLGWLLLLAVLFVAPALWYGSWSLEGTDDVAAQMAEKLQSGFEPWMEPWWEPSAEGESLLFLAQGAIGASFIIFYIFTLRRSKGVVK